MTRVAVSLLLLLAATPARADTLAWRITVEACDAHRCRELPASARRWGGRFACQNRAALMSANADFAPSAKAKGATVRARCIAIEGLPGA